MSDTEHTFEPCRANGGRLIHARFQGSNYSLCGHEPRSRGFLYNRAYWHYWPAVKLSELRQAMNVQGREPCLRCVQKIGAMSDVE